MLEDHLLVKLACRWRSFDGQFHFLVSPYIAYLSIRRYADTTAHIYLKSLAHFAYWMTTESLTLSDINEALIDQFLSMHLLSCNCPNSYIRHLPDIRAALKLLLCVLRQNGFEQPDTLSTPITAELKQFHHYLRETCGIAESTCRYRLKYIHNFLFQHFRMGPVDISQLTPKSVESFVVEYAKHWQPQSLKVIKASLTSYFRFRAMQGDSNVRSLLTALPVLANWTHTTLSKGLTDTQLESFFQTFNLATSIGQRDYAIARCLIDLGLRGHEVVNLHLESVDWHRGILTITNTKGRQARQLPLPIQTGEAIVKYLQHGRPETKNRALFVRHVAPFDKPISVDAIRNAMRYAFSRCSDLNHVSSIHVLRHTTAIRLQRSGATLKEIADLLGHKSLETTTIYAKVDLENLRAIALPWPGSSL